MTKRACTEPGCPELVESGARGGRCLTHRREQRQARGTTTEQGYGYEHEKLRAKYQQRFDRGEAQLCWRCKLLIEPGQPWDLGHDDEDRSKYRGPEHQRCNRAAGGALAGRTEGASPSRALVRGLAARSGSRCAE